MASPYLAWALIFILVPLGMIFYYGLTDEDQARVIKAVRDFYGV